MSYYNELNIEIYYIEHYSTIILYYLNIEYYLSIAVKENTAIYLDYLRGPN